MARRHYRALLLGNSHFPHEPVLLPDLYGPVNDVSQLAAVLADEEVGLFATADVKVCPERDSAEILDELRDLCEAASAHDVLLIYYSGHGLAGNDDSGTLFLAGRDTIVDDARNTAVPYREIAEILDHCAAAAVILVLDCCNSGGAKSSPDTTELAGRGRYIISASRRFAAARDAASVRDLSRFTEHLVNGLRGLAARPDSPDITISNLYDYAFKAVTKDDRSLIPTMKSDGYGGIVIGRAPEQPYEARRKSGFQVPPAPVIARALGRWSLAFVLLVLIYAGWSAFNEAACELAYRAQWQISAFAEHESGSLALGSAFLQIVPLVVGSGLGVFVVAAVLTRILGVAWWILPALLTVEAGAHLFEGLHFYGDNHAALLAVAAIMVVCRYRLPAGSRPRWTHTRDVVLIVAAVWLPCAYLAYHFGSYNSSAWAGGDALMFAELKQSMTVDRVMAVWLAGVAGFTLGAVAVHWLWKTIPVLGSRVRALRWARRPWVRRSMTAGVLLVVVPLATTLAVVDYRSRLDFEFTKQDLHAFASPWFSYLDECDDRDCFMYYWDNGDPIEVDFVSTRDHADAVDSVTSFGRGVVAATGEKDGYTYWIGVYDGHDGTIFWTHTSCACWAAIRVHNNERAYSYAAGIFHDITGVPVPSALS